MAQPLSKATHDFSDRARYDAFVDVGTKPDYDSGFRSQLRRAG